MPEEDGELTPEEAEALDMLTRCATGGFPLSPSFGSLPIQISGHIKYRVITAQGPDPHEFAFWSKCDGTMAMLWPYGARIRKGIKVLSIEFEGHRRRGDGYCVLVTRRHLEEPTVDPRPSSHRPSFPRLAVRSHYGGCRSDIGNVRLGPQPELNLTEPLTPTPFSLGIRPVRNECVPAVPIANEPGGPSPLAEQSPPESIHS